MFAVIFRIDVFGVTMRTRVVGLFTSRQLAGQYLLKKGYEPTVPIGMDELFNENPPWLWCGDWTIELGQYTKLKEAGLLCSYSEHEQLVLSLERGEYEGEEDYMASIEEVEEPSWIPPNWPSTSDFFI